MRLLQKELLIQYQEKRCPCNGFVTYISDTEPILMHCYCWEDYSDAYGKSAISFMYAKSKSRSERVFNIFTGMLETKHGIILKNQYDAHAILFSVLDKPLNGKRATEKYFTSNYYRYVIELGNE